MSDTTVKVRAETRDRVKSMGAVLHLTADGVINAALEELERARLWSDWQAASEAMTAAEVSTYQTDQRLYDNTLIDGLQRDGADIRGRGSDSRVARD